MVREDDTSSKQWLGLTVEQVRTFVDLQTSSRWQSIETEWERHSIDAAIAQSQARSLSHYYDLAEQLAIQEILSESLPLMTELASARQRAEEYGIAVSVSATQLEQQQRQLQELLHQAETAATVSDIALKQAIGHPSGAGQLRPTSDLAVPDSSEYDEATLIDSALTQRADLLALRSMYLNMSVETVPSVETVLMQQIPSLARLRGKPADGIDSLSEETLLHFAQLRAALHQEILHRERVVADEVRSAIANVKLQHAAVARARFNVDEQAESVPAKAEQGPLLELPAKLETIELRTKLMSAVCNWHRANVQLQAAVGAKMDSADRLVAHHLPQ